MSNFGGGSLTVAVTNETGAGVDFGATLSGGTVTVTMDAAKGAAPGDHQGTLRVYRGGIEVAHAAVYAFSK